MQYREDRDGEKLSVLGYGCMRFSRKGSAIDLEKTEKEIGWKLPNSYIALLKIMNGGRINYDIFEESWLEAIYGVSLEEGGLVDMFDNWINEWQYPNIGIPFGQTQSAGHDMYFMDFRSIDKNGEPRIVHIDNEFDNEITVVADNLEDLLTKIYFHEEI